jgi:hypothetical protein
MLELKNSNEYIEKNLQDLEVIGVGDTIRIIDQVIGLDVENRVLSIKYNPIMAINTELEIANTIELITDKINEIDTDTVKQDRLYNNVSISQDYGFRAVRSDKRARTTMGGGTISMDVGDGDGNYTPAVYFDVESGKYMINGDGIFEGTVYAENIDTINARIQVAQIEDLIVGNNVQMGPNAVISWGKVTDIPTNIVYQAVLENYPTETELANTLASYTTDAKLAVALAGYVTSGVLSTTLADYLTNGNFNTLIGQDYIVTGKIAANQIAVGTLTGFTIKTAPDGSARIVTNASGYKTYNAANQLHGVYMDVLGGSSSFRVFDSDILKYSLFYGMVDGDAVNKVRLTSVGCPMKISAGSDNMSITAANIYMEGNVSFNGTVTGINAIAKFA